MVGYFLDLGSSDVSFVARGRESSKYSPVIRFIVC